MTQALQIPMLMLSSDTMLKPDGLATSSSDSGYEQSGADGSAAFGQLLSGMVEQGKNGKAQVGQRQIPAGVANLSSLSAALLQADISDIEQSGTSGGDDSVLANSLLQQIALGWQTDGQDSAEQDIDAQTAAEQPISEVAIVLALQTLSAETENGKTAVDTKVKGEPVASVLKAELTEAAQQQAENAGTETAADAEDKSSALNPKVATATATSDSKASPESVSASLQSAESEGSERKAATAQSGTVTDNATTFARDSAQALVSDGAQTAVTDNPSAAEILTVKPGKTLTSEKSVSATESQKMAASQEVVSADSTEDIISVQSADMHTEAAVLADNELLSQNSKLQLDDRDGTDTDKKSVLQTKTIATAALASDSQAEKAGSEAKTDNAILHAMAQAPTNNAQGQANRNSTDAASEAAQQKVQTVQYSAPADNGAAADGDAQQQNPAERQLASELPNGLTRTASENNLARAEQTFAGALHSAQQSARSHDISRPQLKTVSEQLQQSLNLQQHDAAGQLRERVSLMVRQNIQIAEIRLDPVGLGQMQIKVDVQQDQTNVQFVVQQSQAKELIEQQLPRLREMLQQQGIVLGEGSVQQQSQQERQLAQGQQQQHGQAGGQAGELADSAQAEGSAAQINVAAPDRLVDYYA